MNRRARARFAGVVLAVAVAVGPLTPPLPAPQSTSRMLVAADAITDSTSDGTGGVTFGSYAGAQVDAWGGLEHGRGTSEPVLDAGRLKLAESYGKLPLSFEPNQGQTDSRVRFLSRGNGYSLFLTPTEAVLTLRGPAEGGSSGLRAAPGPNGRPALPPNGGGVLRMKLHGANPAPTATGLEELPGKSNYFIGNDPKQWRTNVPNYGKVRFAGVYPGVDLVYYGNQRQLEYDFVVAPGADPSAIRLGIAGAERLEIDPQGELALQTSAGEVRWRKPVVYQEVGGVRQMVDGHYVRKGKEAVGFEVASYDPRHPLIIDPVLLYSTYLGGSGTDAFLFGGIAVDGSGNAYVAGLTNSTNFPTASPSPPPFQAAFGGGNQDAFVARLNTNASGVPSLVYSTYLGGSGDDGGTGIAVDASGNAYVTGATNSADFPMSSPFQGSLGGGNCGILLCDAFVTKLNPSGTGLVYSTYLGGIGDDEGIGIAVDSSVPPNAYVTGDTSSANFPTAPPSPSPLPFQGTLGGGKDAFVTNLNGTGSALVYSTYLGGSSDDQGNAIAVDSSGNAYVTGTTLSANFPKQIPFDGTFGGTQDAFVTKLNGTGSALVYSTYLGGSGLDFGFGIAVDSGNAYVTGTTFSLDFPTLNAFQAGLGGGVSDDAFVTRLNATGSALVYSTYLGGSGIEGGRAIAVDSSGNAYVTGVTASSNFPTANAVQSGFGGGQDAFVAKLNTNASGLASRVYATFLGGAGNFEVGLGIAVDSSGNAYVTGGTNSSNFPTAPSPPFQAAFGGGFSDAFVSKLGVFNTAVGTNVLVTPLDVTTGTSPVMLTFSNVTQAGNTTLTTSSSGPAPPSGFAIGNPPIYYDLSTTALFSGNVTVCISYAGITFSSGSPSLFHFENGVPVDVTTSVDTVNQVVCGNVTSLSPFALFQPVAPPSAPSIAKVFGAAAIPLGSNTSLTFTLGNPNSTALSGVSFNDPLPAGLIVATPNELTGSCGGTVTAAPGSSSITLTGGTLAPNSGCTFSVTITGHMVGSWTNVTGNVTSIEGGSGGTASSSLTVQSQSPQPFEGCGPGFWKNHAGVGPGPQGNAWPAPYTPATLLSSVFTIPSCVSTAFPNASTATLHEALGFKGGSGIGGAAQILLRAAVAALLNAQSPDVNYPLTTAQVMSMVNAALASCDRNTMLTLAGELDENNNLGCPIGNGSSTGIVVGITASAPTEVPDTSGTTNMSALSSTTSQPASKPIAASDNPVGLGLSVIIPAASVSKGSEMAAKEVSRITSVKLAGNQVDVSGRLVDSSGAPLTGVGGITFAFYPEKEGGSPVWLETRNVELDKDGRYTVRIALPAELGALESHWLGAQVQGQAEQTRVVLR